MIDPINFSGIFQALPGNYIILLPDAPRFTIVTFNETRAEQTFTRQEHIGMGIFEAFPDNPDDPQANGVSMLNTSLQTVLKEKKTHQMAVQKYDIPTADRLGFEERYWLPKNIPVLDDKGDIIYIIHHVQDVSEQVFAEKRENAARRDLTQQRAFAEELSRLVQERTKELQNTNDSLERSNGELEQFAYVTSHDLQAPLRKIQVYASRIIGVNEWNPKSADDLEKISAAAGRMRGLINDLLEYSRLSTTANPFQEIDLNEVLKQVLSDFELNIEQQKAMIRADRLETIHAVPLHMNQLFLNLLGNALKFAKKDVPAILTIKGSKLAKEKKENFPSLLPDREYYEIIISDNGVGFDQAHADKIFTLFHRLNNASDYAGHGIGLALCSKVVNYHQGVIHAESVIDEGTSFTVILPYRQN
jgi:signal transduction histidine kinase